MVAACAIWGKQWQNKRVLVWCDNMEVVQVLSSLSSREPGIMHLLRCLHHYLALHNIHLTRFAAGLPPAGTGCRCSPNTSPTVPRAGTVLSARGLDVARLAGIAEGLIADSLAPSSQHTYTGAQEALTLFCHALKVPAAPAGGAPSPLYGPHVTAPCSQLREVSPLCHPPHAGAARPPQGQAQVGPHHLGPAEAEACFKGQLPPNHLSHPAIVGMSWHAMLQAACCVGFFEITFM